VHGVIFTSFRQFSWSELGSQADEIWAGRPRYLAVEAYPDEDFDALVDHAAEVTGMSRRELLLAFGAYTSQTMFLLLRPEYYESSTGTRDFLLGVEERIHEVLRRTIPGVAPPRLNVVPLGEHGVSITYTSERRLCHLLEGLVVGTAGFYGERVAIEQTTCMERGDVACCFFVTPA
jgi:hypothetical protein